MLDPRKDLGVQRPITCPNFSADRFVPPVVRIAWGSWCDDLLFEVAREWVWLGCSNWPSRAALSVSLATIHQEARRKKGSLILAEANEGMKNFYPAGGSKNQAVLLSPFGEPFARPCVFGRWSNYRKNNTADKESHSSIFQRKSARALVPQHPRATISFFREFQGWFSVTVLGSGRWLHRLMRATGTANMWLVGAPLVAFPGFAVLRTHRRKMDNRENFLRHHPTIRAFSRVAGLSEGPEQGEGTARPAIVFVDWHGIRFLIWRRPGLFCL
ncbi:MAG: hypothetical protein JWM16_5145 [Verrucomicrobiales bacterium]|nr:hypothetical protein [Verrucomicrobiales bacterium]